MALIAFHDPRLSSTSGGGETVTLQLISLLLRAGHDVTAVTRKSLRSRLFEQAIEREPRLRCIEIEMEAGGVNEILTNDALAARIWNCDRLAPESLQFNLASRTFYERKRFDLVVVSFIPDLALLSTSDRILLNVFGLPPDEAIATLERPLLNRASQLTFASHYIKRQFQELFRMSPGIDPGPVIHASLQSAFFEQVTTAGKDFDACFVGRLVRRKGLHTILEAMVWLKCNRQREITLAIAGDGHEREALESKAREFEIAQQVKWFGAVGPEAVVRIMRRSRTFVYPTLEPESFGCSNLEAMACGVPVITTNLGGTSDYVRPGHNALVCQPGSAESLAHAIELVIDDKQGAQYLRAEGKATARMFHPSRITPRWLKLFDELCSERPKADEQVSR